jgi:hypothetical protein
MRGRAAGRQAFIALMFGGGLLLPVPAQAQAHPVRRMDFDLWCTEEMRLPFARCAERRSEDLQKFEAFRDVIEKYEFRQRREQDSGIHLDRLPWVEPTPKTPPPEPAKTDGG